MEKRVCIFLVLVFVTKDIFCVDGFSLPPTPGLPSATQTSTMVSSTPIAVKKDSVSVSKTETTSTEQPKTFLGKKVSSIDSAEDVEEQGIKELSEEQIGLQGNWVKKKEFLKDAYKINEQVQDMVVKIQKSRKGFYERFTKINQELADFYKNEGLQQGKTEAIFQGVEDYIEKRKLEKQKKLKKESVGVTSTYDVKLGVVDEQVNELQDYLEQLRLDVKSIEQLDKSIKARLDIVDKQINVALEESVKSRDMTNQIWYIIDDKKARTVFYNLKGGVYQKVKSIQDYVQSVLADDFSRVLNVTRTRMAAAKSGIENLEKKGMIIRNRAERIKQIKLAQLEKAKETEEITLEKEAKQPKPTWYGRVYSFFVNTSAVMYNWVQNAAEWFGNVFGDKKSISKQSVPTTMPSDAKKA